MDRRSFFGFAGRGAVAATVPALVTQPQTEAPQVDLVELRDASFAAGVEWARHEIARIPKSVKTRVVIGGHGPEYWNVGSTT